MGQSFQVLRCHFGNLLLFVTYCKLLSAFLDGAGYDNNNCINKNNYINNICDKAYLRVPMWQYFNSFKKLNSFHFEISKKIFIKCSANYVVLISFPAHPL